MHLWISVKDLIDRGQLKAPSEIVGFHSGAKVEGVVLPDGSIQIQGEIYSSPSPAAGAAITKATGRTTPGRSYFSINGWKFWHVRVSNRETSLDELRKISRLGR